jgi:hypothetical protein
LILNSNHIVTESSYEFKGNKYLSQNTKEVDDAIKGLRDGTLELFNFLMGAEMVIVEQFEEVLKDFERSYLELCSGCNEFGSTSFARLRDIENEHQEKFTEQIIIMCDRFNKGDTEEVEDEIRDVNIVYFRLWEIGMYY